MFCFFYEYFVPSSPFELSPRYFDCSMSKLWNNFIWLWNSRREILKDLGLYLSP